MSAPPAYSPEALGPPGPPQAGTFQPSNFGSGGGHQEPPPMYGSPQQHLQMAMPGQQYAPQPQPMMYQAQHQPGMMQPGQPQAVPVHASVVVGGQQPVMVVQPQYPQYSGAVPGMVGAPVGQPQPVQYGCNPGMVLQQGQPMVLSGPPVRVPKHAREPTAFTCPHCHCEGVTKTKTRPGCTTFVFVIMLLFSFFPLAWIPLCCPICMDVHHECPHCKKTVSKAHRHHGRGGHHGHHGGGWEGGGDDGGGDGGGGGGDGGGGGGGDGGGGGGGD